MTDTAELAAFLLRETGLRVTSLVRVAQRSHTVNFRAVAADGREVLVKLAPPASRLAAVDHPLAAHDLFPGRRLAFHARRVFCLDWKAGRPKTLAALSAKAVGRLVAAYGSFRAALGNGRIHGDLNCNNVLFASGKVSGFLDLEEVRAGSPCEDWVRYALTGAEHLPVFSWLRRRRLRENFRRIVSATGFPAAEWRAAIDGFAAAKRARKARRGKLSLFARANLAWRSRFYARLKKEVG